MRICCLSAQLPAHVAVGGMSEQTRLLSRMLAAHGHDVTVVTTRHPQGVTEALDGGVRVLYLPETEPGSIKSGWWRASTGAFARLHADAPFDVVWSQSVAGSRVARRFLRRDTAPPLVAFIHGTGPEMARSLVNALRGTPQSWRAAPTTARRLLRCAANFALVDPPVYRHASAVIAVSRAVAASVRAWYRVPAERVTVVPNGVDTERFRPDDAARARVRARLGYADTDCVLFVAGALTRQKGVDLAIAAYARLVPRHPGLRLLVAGDGAARSVFERRACALAAAVRFLGAVPPDGMPELYAAADVVLFPTRRVEGFAHVLVEAMATERPVVATRIGGNPDALTDGESGYLVDVDDLDTLVARVDRLAASPELRAGLGRRGRSRVEREFTLAQQAARVVAVFERVVRSR
jgi:glycosyltransferase involved in cell wall biosynthesis